MLRLVRMIKLARILKASRVLKRFSNMLLNDLDFPRATLKMGTLTILLLLVTHWTACLWSIISLNMAQSLADDVVPDTWVGAYVEHELVSHGREVQPIDLYISALYWAFMTLTSIGYGDFYPRNTVERAFSCILQLMSGMVWAYVIGTMAAIAATIDPNAIAFEQTMDHLNRFMAERRLPRSLRNTLREYFEAARRVHRVGDDDQLIHGMSPMLQGAVATCTTGRWLKGIPFLSIMSDTYDRDQGFITNLATRMRVSAYVKSERLPLGRLYIMRKGMAVKLWKLYVSSRAWGEDILLDDPELVDHAQAVALTFSETFHLQRSDFEGASELFPEQYARVRRHIRLHLQLQRILLRALAKESGKMPRSFVARSVAKGFSFVEPEGPTLEQKVDKLLSSLNISMDGRSHDDWPSADQSHPEVGQATGSAAAIGAGSPAGLALPMPTALPAPARVSPAAALDSARIGALDAKLDVIGAAVRDQRLQIASIIQHIQATAGSPGRPAVPGGSPSAESGKGNVRNLAA